MGCCSSNFTTDKHNATHDGYYESTTPTRSASKRSYSSRISSDSSSGVFSRCTTPSRRSPTPNQQTITPKPKPNNFNFQNDVPKTFAMLSICDDFCEAAQAQSPQLQQHCDLDKSFGYFSETMSGSSCAGSTPTKAALRRTQDTSLCSMTKPSGDLEMEMYMMTHAQQIMPKSSTPVCQRRETTFTLSREQRKQKASHSYNKWCNYLQTTPAYLLHNVTNIPEAVAGHFSPLNFPAFTDLEDMESAAKRFKVDVHNEDDESMYLQPAFGLTHTIATDL